VRDVRFGQCIEGIFEGHVEKDRGTQIGNYWSTSATDCNASENSRGVENGRGRL